MGYRPFSLLTRATREPLEQEGFVGDPTPAMPSDVRTSRACSLPGHRHCSLLPTVSVPGRTHGGFIGLGRSRLSGKKGTCVSQHGKSFMEQLLAGKRSRALTGSVRGSSALTHLQELLPAALL